MSELDLYWYRQRALRVFAMSDKGKNGLLNAKALADGTDMIFVEMLQGSNALGLLSMSEWLESVQKLVLQDEVKAGLFLDLCEKHISQQKEQWPLRNEALQVYRMMDRNGDFQLDMGELTGLLRELDMGEQWPLRDEALQVFRMGDRNGDCQLDMGELTEIRQSADLARTLLDSVDVNKDGTVSKREWLAYIKRLADQDEKSAAAILALYRKHLSNSGNTAKAYVAAKSALDALAGDSSVVASRPWWACF